MPSIYLQPTDYVSFGAPNATPEGVIQASTLIDAYLLRPQGLIYEIDATGQPCYMVNPVADVTFTALSSFSAGASVKVAVSGPVQSLQVGDCLTLDRTVTGLVETVAVIAIDQTNGYLTLGNISSDVKQGVLFSHAAGCKMELGLTLMEQRTVPKARATVRLAHLPLTRVISGVGRYGYGRRGDSASLNMDNFNLLASVSKFGGPPAWELWPASNNSGINPMTGEVWVPAGIMLAYYSEVKIHYVCGFRYATLPPEIKYATSQLVQGLANNPMLGDVTKYRAGDTEIEQLTSSMINADVKTMLAPWRAKAFV